MFLTETAKLAHVVLPATSWAESDGTYTNLERRVQRGPDAIDSIEGCLPGWAILTRMADRWISTQTTHTAPTDSCPRLEAEEAGAGRGQGHCDAEAVELSGRAQAVLEEISKAVPVYAGMRWESLGEQGQQWPATALARPARRFEPVEVQPLPAVMRDSFVLVSGPVLWDGGIAHAALGGPVAGPDTGRRSSRSIRRTLLRSMRRTGTA